MMNQKQQGLKIVREFNAPREIVFNAFASAEAMGQWWGPAGVAIEVKHFSFEKGGTFHYKMGSGEQTMWGLFRYQQIQRPELIEFISSFSDEQGNVSVSPFPMDFPLEILNQITLAASGDKTTLTIQGYPINATQAQLDTYNSIMANMQQGFAGTFDKLDRYLESLNG